MRNIIINLHFKVNLLTDFFKSFIEEIVKPVFLTVQHVDYMLILFRITVEH